LIIIRKNPLFKLIIVLKLAGKPIYFNYWIIDIVSLAF